MERVSGTRTLRTTGRVAPNENAVYPLVAGAEGVVREVKGATTGSFVRRNEVLLSFFAPDFVNAQIQYLSGLDTLNRVTSAGGCRALRQRPAQPGRLRAAARRAPGDAEPRAVHPDPLAGGRLRARPEGGRGPELRPGLRVLPHRRPAPGVGARRRVREPGAVHPSRVEGPGHLSGPGSPARGHGQPRGADVRRGNSHPEGAAGHRQPRLRAETGDVRGRLVRHRAALVSSRSRGSDRGLGPAQDRVRRPGQWLLRAPARSRRGGASPTRSRSRRASWRASASSSRERS